SNRGGHFEVWIAEADGRAARELSHDGNDAENPTATADGFVLYSSGTPGRRGIWRMRLHGSAARMLVPGVTVHPEVSPDGRFAVFAQPFVPGTDTTSSRRLVALSEGELITESLGVAPDGQRLLISFIERAPNLVVAEGVPELAAPQRPGS